MHSVTVLEFSTKCCPDFVLVFFRGAPLNDVSCCDFTSNERIPDTFAREWIDKACSITDKAGQLITGQRFPELGQSLAPLKAGTRFSCRFRFEGSLQPGLYFINAGAWNCPEKIYLHRIIDGCALRVLMPRTTNFGFGLVDLSSSAPELAVDENASANDLEP